jgi:signal transduction histidine kinase
MRHDSADSTRMRSKQTPVLTWAIGGVSLGLLLFGAGWIVAFAHTPQAPLRIVMADEPVLWVVTLTPVILGVVGGLVGLSQGNAKQSQDDAIHLAERVAAEFSTNIHNQNVETARTAGIQAKYFASLSHDMRTPLSAIIGFSAIVEDSELIPRSDLITYMHEIGTSANQLLTIVGDLLDAAKLENGSIELQVDDVAGDAVAAEVLHHLSPLIEGRHLRVRTNFDAPKTCRADEQRLRQILTNLLSNAIKYTPAGVIEVNSYVRGDKVVFEVVDSGLGISKDDMEKVFVPFEQTDAGKSRTDSTGLGLPVALGMAQAMGGTIEAESEGNGKGSTFRLVLPTGSGSGVEVKLAALPVIAA